MCWLTYHKDNAVIKTAEKNIPVDKLVFSKYKIAYKTLHFGASYRLGHKYYAKDKHKKRIKDLTIVISNIAFEIHEGIHTVSRNVWSFMSSGYRIRAYIPKGAKYAYSPSKHEYVSTELVTLKTVIQA